MSTRSISRSLKVRAIDMLMSMSGWSAPNPGKRWISQRSLKLAPTLRQSERLVFRCGDSETVHS